MLYQGLSPSIPLRRVAQHANEPIRDAIRHGLRCSCTVYVKSNADYWTGSGFHVGKGLVITAGHVAPQETGGAGYRIDCSFDGKDAVPLRLVLSDQDIDAAVLKVEGPVPEGIGVMKLGNSNYLLQGDPIAVVSAPEGFHDSVTEGIISNVHQSLGQYAPSQAWHDVIFITADILEGSSGGMVVGEDQNVYGTIMGVAGQHAEMGIGERAACPSNKIVALLARAMAKLHKRVN